MKQRKLRRLAHDLTWSGDETDHARPGREQLRLRLVLSVAVILVACVSAGVGTSAASTPSPPTTNVLIPANGASLSGTTTLDAAASNATSVEFRLFGGSYGYSGPVVCTATLTYYGWLCSWNTATVANGSYSLLSEAFNRGGSAFSAGVNITVTNPPTTSVLIPDNGPFLSGTTTLDAAASNATSVEFRLFGGSYGYSGPVICTATLTYYGWLCSWNTGTVADGSYVLLSEAFNAGGSAFSAGVNITVTDISPGPPITYTTFAGQQETLTPWVGQNVAVLTPVGGSFSSATMSEIVGALDAAWHYYASITGRQPTPASRYDGRDTIAVVTTTCGAACSYLGATGTEINPSYFQTLYDGVQSNNQYDQALFYEFGRNFWFYGSQLAPNTTYGSIVTTGYAVLMRFQSMDAIRVQGGPYNGTPFATFQAQDWGIADDYDADLSQTFANTLAVGQSPSVYGGTDFFASIVHLLATHYGGDCFLQHFLTTVTSEPSVTTDDAAVANFITAASQVAGIDLRPFFYDYWSFPQPDGTTNPRAAGGIAELPGPSPSAICPS